MSCRNCPLMETETSLGVYTFNPRDGESLSPDGLRFGGEGLDERELSVDDESSGTASSSSRSWPGRSGGCDPNKTISLVFVVILDGPRTVVIVVIVVVVFGSSATFVSAFDVDSSSSFLESGSCLVLLHFFLALSSSAFRRRSVKSWPARMSRGIGRFFS